MTDAVCARTVRATDERRADVASELFAISTGCREYDAIALGHGGSPSIHGVSGPQRVLFNQWRVGPQHNGERDHAISI